MVANKLSTKKRIKVNAKVLNSKIAGVQRYLSEIIDISGHDLDIVRPKSPLGGIKGHLWEQFILPLSSMGALLWSPSQSGPLICKNQVVTIHDVVHMDHPEWLSRLYVIWYRFLLPRLVMRVRHVITDSEFSKERLLATTKVAPDKISVIPLGVDSRFHPRDPQMVSTVLEPLKLPTKRYLLTVGSVVPRKNLPRLIAAWRIAQASVSDEIWLVIAGGVGKSQVFRQEILGNDMPPRVFMTGHVDDNLLPALYSGATAFAYVSQYEGFGIPSLEAMASGVPVIVSNTTAFPEVVGNAGLYVDPLNVSEIAENISRLLNDQMLATKLSELGLERAKQFTWQRTAARTLRVLNEAAAEMS